jgi:hypothetical protein
MASAVCAYEILSLCGPRIKDLIYSGTSGWSPALGGIINNGSCETGTFNRLAQIVRWDCWGCGQCMVVYRCTECT